MTRRRVALSLSMVCFPGLLALSCQPTHDTSVVIHVMSDVSLGLAGVDLTARPLVNGAPVGGDAASRSAHFPDPAHVSWILYPGASGMFTIELEARGLKTGSADPVVSQRAVVAFQPGSRKDVYMTLAMACTGVSCPVALTCQQGACVDPTVVGGTTPPDAAAADVPTDLGAGAPDRGPSDGRADAGDAPADRGAVDGAMQTQLGSACVADQECGSGHCVDGVCCNDVCTGSCQRCNDTTMPGICVSVAAGQPAPTTRAACAKDDVSTCMRNGLCDGKGSCQLYPDGQVCAAASCNPTGNTINESRCDGMGACKAVAPQSCAPFRCKAGDALCARTCTIDADCDGQPCLNNSCGKLRPGAVCAADADCQLGFCVDKVCCDSRCAGQCQACNLSSSVGTCSSVKSGQPVGGRAACTGSGACGGTCAGQSDCAYPSSAISCRTMSCDVSMLTAPANCNGAGACSALSTSACPNHLRCLAGGTACLVQCATSADCVAGFYCAGTACAPTKASGTACATGGECTSSLCVDKVCCNAACSGSCQTCATGSCLAVNGADDADTCTGTSTCSAAGTCLKKPGQVCVAGSECANGICIDGHCCNSACTGACQTCATGTCSPVANADDPDTCTGMSTCSGTGTCVAKQGQVCTTGTQCSSGLCVDSRCCNTACNGGCQTCATGTCTAVSGVDDPDSCTGASTCNAAGACLLKPGGVCTASTQCASGQCVDGRCCNSACTGSCQTCANTTGTCSPVVNADDTGTCTGTSTCNASGVCLAKLGGVCTTSTQCASGQCVDGRCCNSACTGSCQSCANTTGTCSPVINADDTGTCTGTSTCNASGVCLLKLGGVCATNAQCASGQCVDGRCCGSACNGVCQSCANTAGTCSPVVNADDDTCTGSTTCNASGACLARPGSTCTTNAQCANGMCVDGHCCNTTCTGTCQSCNNSTGTCSTVANADDNTCTGASTCSGTGACLLKLGGACTTNAQCANGTCVDGHCCNSTCTGACMSCNNSTGTCSRVVSADDVGTCSGASTCDANGACLLKVGGACSVGTQCANGICSSDGVCCSTTCGLACQGCAAANTGVATGTCAARTTGTTRPCPTVNPSACADLQSDASNCGACGMACPTTGLPTGTTRACVGGSCGASCTTAGTQLCTLQSGIRNCAGTVWTFEATATGETFWLNGGDNNSVITTTRPHNGAQSLEVTPSSTQPAIVLNFPCSDSATGTLDLRGKLFTAFLSVATSPGSSFAGTSCRLSARDSSLVEVPLNGTPSVSPIVPAAGATFFRLSGTFPTTAQAANVGQINIQCTLPADWTLDNPAQRWWVDDVRVDTP